MNVTFFQTADPERYREMLLATSRTVARYVAPRGFAQEVFLGYKRGVWPWQASFNRIYIFEELIARGWADWAVYLDADAFIADLDFDLAAYLSDKRDRAAIMTHSNATRLPWDVNNGVLMLNLRHPFALRMVAGWRERFEAAYGDDTLRERPDWSNPDDQELLQETIRTEPDIAGTIHFESYTLINSLDARFIRQVLRSAIPDLAERTRVICGHVAAVLQQGETTPDEAQRERERVAAVVTHAYQTLLGRNVDASGLAYYGRMVELLGPDAGARKIAFELMQSQEYRDRLSLTLEAQA